MKLEQLASGFQHTEGPVWLPEKRALLFSEGHGPQHGRYVLRPNGHPERLADNSDYPNGNARAPDGTLYGCSHGRRALERRRSDGTWISVATHYRGARLNSPNDCTVRTTDGTVWFTDPPYGITQPGQGYPATPEQPGSYVYCFDPQTGHLRAAITDMYRPNGLVFAPDQTHLYVADSSHYDDPERGFCHVRRYRIGADGAATFEQIFARNEHGEPDGLAVDAAGNLYVTTAVGVDVYTPDGAKTRVIPVPEVCANVCFGAGRLWVCAGGSVYASSEVVG